MKIIAALFTATALVLIGLFHLFQLGPAAAPAPAPSATAFMAVQLYAEPVLSRPVTEASSIEEVYAPSASVVYWSDVPRDWKVCVDEAKVYGNPGENLEWFLRSLPKGTSVQVRELDSSRTFAMINPAEYVKFTDLCR
jgi:hypothetical protein